MERPLHILLLVSSLLSINFPSHFFSEKATSDYVLLHQSEMVAVTISAATNGSLPDEEVGYCQTGQSTVTFTNDGMANDPAMSIINDLSIGVALGDAFSLQDGGFEITSVSIAGVQLNSFAPLNDLSSNPLFSTDPDGTGGLSDVDNDGFFDDLELGQSVEITVNYDFDCTQAASIDLPSNCLNNSSTTLNAQLQYTESGQQQLFSLDNYLSPVNESFDEETFSVPDAFAGVDTFSITQTLIRRIRNFESNCNGSGEFRANIDIPNGFISITDRFKLIKNGVDEVPIIDVVETSSSVDFTFNASFSDILSGEYELEMIFTTDCFPLLGPSAIPVTFSHFCPACSCEHVWYCGNVEGPYLHTISPPCPGEVLLDCDNGILAHSFEVNRSSFGFADADFTIPFDPNLANTKVALPCDKVDISFKSTVGQTNIVDSIGLVINYGTPNNAQSPEELFLFEIGNLRFVKNGTSFDCLVDTDMLTTVMNGSEKTNYFDLHSCLANLNLTLEEGDSINFMATYSINPNAIITTSFLPIPNFRAYAYHEVDGVQLSCDSYGDLFYVGKSRALYDFPNSVQGMPAGCNDGELHFRLFIPENKFDQFFGNELRQAQKVEYFTLDFDPVLLESYDLTEVLVSIPGHPIHGDSYYPIKPLSDFPDGQYVALFDTLNYVPSLNIIEEYTIDVQLNLTPNCLANINSDIPFQSAFSFKDRFYASNIDNGGCVEDVSVNGNSSIFYSNPNIIEIETLSPVSATVVGDEAEWTFQICNSSTSSNANTVWVAIEDGTGALNVLALENVDDPNSPIGITLSPYGLNHQFGLIGPIIGTQCVEFKLTANAVGCQNLDFQIVAGWDCSPLNAPDWTPDDNDCLESVTNLNLVNAGTSPVSLNISDWTSECSNAGEESLNFTGSLVAITDVPTDNFTLSFIHDENGDGIAQNTEPLVHQESFIGAVSIGNPFILNATFNSSVSDVCNLIVTVSADNTNLCDGIEIILPTPQILNAGTDEYICTLNGGNIITNLGSSNCNAVDYSFNWIALAPAEIAFLDDSQIAQPQLTFDPTGFIGDTLIYILETQRMICNETTNDTVRIILPNTSLGYFENDTINIQSADCAAGVEFCLGIPVSSLSEFSIELNGIDFPTANTGICNTTEAVIALPVGSHQIILNNAVAGCIDSIVAIVSCTQTDVVNIPLTINSSDTICLNSSELNSSIVSVSNLCLDGSFVSYDVSNDSCIVFTGILVGSEMACYIACDGDGFCDTTLFNLEVSHPFEGGLNDTIVISQNSDYCFDENLLNINGGIESFENICESQSGDEVVFNLDPMSNCIFYDGIAIGTDSACLEFCDGMGNCDTILYSVTVVPGNIETDTVFITVDTNYYCIDSMLLLGSIVDIQDICPENNSEQVFFEITGNCVKYWGDELGIDTACIRVEDEYGNVALINLVVTVVKTTPLTFCDTIFVGEIVEYCLDTLELPGRYETFEILYDDSSVENAEFDLNSVNLCVLYEGLEVGLDSFSIALCDHYGFCDTTSFCLTVNPYFDPPSLNTDCDTTLKETPIVIDALANDTVFGGIVDYYISSPPISGDAIINLDGSITYIPSAPFCDREDFISYVACNPNGCDTTTIKIRIECIELTIFNAVSPNNDGYNDYFYISKITSFDNRLWIYNRWGNEVFAIENYDNSWPGTWGSDIDLPDGTYFYILEWTENGIQTVQKGYFEMYR